MVLLFVKGALSLFLPNGNIVLIAQTVVCLIYTNVGLIHAIVLLSHNFVILGGFNLMSCLKDVPMLRGDNYTEWRKKVDLSFVKQLVTEKYIGGAHAASLTLNFCLICLVVRFR